MFANLSRTLVNTSDGDYSASSKTVLALRRRFSRGMDVSHPRNAAGLFGQFKDCERQYLQPTAGVSSTMLSRMSRHRLSAVYVYIANLRCPGAEAAAEDCTERSSAYLNFTQEPLSDEP